MSTKRTEYNQTWQAKNPERAKYLRDRTAARRFLRKAEPEDVEEMERLIAERREENGRGNEYK